MTTIPLTRATINAYLGSSTFRACDEISSIHAIHDVEQNCVCIEATIPATSSNQRQYKIQVNIRDDGTQIVSSHCTCPIGIKCKHIHKVLCRVAISNRMPIGGPSPQHKKRVHRRNELTRQMEHASVYLVITCMSEQDSGSDFRRSWTYKDNFDQEILGVFFSKRQANECAKAYATESCGYEEYESENEDEDGMSDDEVDSDDEESFCYEDEGGIEGPSEGYSKPSFAKVWVERRAIQDASPAFRK